MSIHFKVAGSGSPVLLIHGLFGSLENVGGIARLLAKSHRVYSIDLPNHGRSSHTQSTSLTRMAEEVEAWMATENLQHVDVVGHSLGGKVGMALALSYPNRVNKLTVIDIAPVDYPPRHNDVFAALNAVDPRTIRSRGDADALMLPFVPEAAVRTFLLKNLQRNDAGQFQWRMNLPVIESGYRDLIAGNDKQAVFSGDVLFLKGGDSDYITEGARAQTLALFPNTKMRIIANTGHWLHAEKPELVSRTISQFFQGN